MDSVDSEVTELAEQLVTGGRRLLLGSAGFNLAVILVIAEMGAHTVDRERDVRNALVLSVVGFGLVLVSEALGAVSRSSQRVTTGWITLVAAVMLASCLSLAGLLKHLSEPAMLAWIILSLPAISIFARIGYGLVHELRRETDVPEVS